VLDTPPTRDEMAKKVIKPNRRLEEINFRMRQAMKISTNVEIVEVTTGSARSPVGETSSAREVPFSVMRGCQVNSKSVIALTVSAIMRKRTRYRTQTLSPLHVE